MTEDDQPPAAMPAAVRHLADRRLAATLALLAGAIISGREMPGAQLRSLLQALADRDPDAFTATHARLQRLQLERAGLLKAH